MHMVDRRVLNDRAIQIIYIIHVEWPYIIICQQGQRLSWMFCSTKSDRTDKDRKITVIYLLDYLSTAEVEFFSDVKMTSIEMNSNELTRERERERERTMHPRASE